VSAYPPDSTPAPRLSAPLRPKIPPCLILALGFRQPLHVARLILPARAQRDDVVYFALVTGRRYGIGALVLGDGLGTMLDFASDVSRATLALDGTASTAQGAAMATPRGGGMGRVST
jgi:hypothetical protein